MMELKPCPFCGGNAYPGSSTIGYTIQCGDCGATSVCMLALDAAVERWNRRATDENAAYERAWPAKPPREWLQAMAGEPLLLAASDEQALRHIYDDLRVAAIRALKS